MFQRKEITKNTVKGTENAVPAVRRLQAWYNDRYGKTLELTSINKANASDLLQLQLSTRVRPKLYAQTRRAPSTGNCSPIFSTVPL